MPKIIGLTGFAQSGKDTFYALSKEVLKEEYGIESCRVAFADQLKYELQDLIRDSFGLDIFNLKPEQKEQIRPLMVEYGRLCRNLSNGGNYWIDRLSEKLKNINLNSKGVQIQFLTDCRYQNEIDWLLGMSGAFLSIVKIKEGVSQQWASTPETEENPNFLLNWVKSNISYGEKLRFYGPANQEEARTITPLIEKSDNLIVWPHVGNNNIQSLKPFVSEFWKKNPQLLETKH